jgi:hypothetical protein
LVYNTQMNVVTQVTLTKSAEKDVRKIPRNIQEALLTWITQVSTQGLASKKNGEIELLTIIEVNKHKY